MSLYDLLPDAEKFLALEPEELAGVILEYLNSGSGELNRYNFGLSHTVSEYPREYHERIRKAISEAWVWLEREGLLAPLPGDSSGNWAFITRRGERLKKSADVAAYRRSALLPARLLHPSIRHRVESAFLRGEYDVAIFQAFREVEIAVRDAGGFDPSDLGAELMRKAFKTAQRHGSPERRAGIDCSFVCWCHRIV